MVWNSTKFCAQAPEPPPATTVTASIMYHAHQSFSGKDKNAAWPPKEHSLQAFTDTCAQTCTSGPEILNLLQCSPSFLVPTSHGVRGITGKALEVLGCPKLLISVDHKPLVTIFGDQPLEKITNPRLLNYKERSLMYQFSIKHTPGKHHIGPDATSHYPSTKINASCLCTILQTSSNHAVTPTDIDNTIKSSIAANYHADENLRAITCDRITAAVAQDEECQLFCKTITTGFPASKDELPELIRWFWTMKEDLYVLHGVILKGNKILIPHPLRAEVLECLHTAHQGVNGMSANALQRLFWPGIDAHLCQTQAQCKACNTIAPSQPREPMSDPTVPQFPFQQTVADLCDIRGNKYIIFIDHYTGWVEATLVQEAMANKICNHLQAWFCTYSAPMSCHQMVVPHSRATHTHSSCQTGESNTNSLPHTTLKAMEGQSSR